MTDELASLINLRSVEMENCSLTKLPNLSKLPYLYELRVSHNHLSRIDGLNSINRLFVDNNLLTEIPTLIEAEYLMHLSISSNPLNHIEDLSSFIGLQQLILSNTNITSIPSSISKLQDLMELYLSGNRLSKLPINIFDIPQLSILTIDDNLFSADEIKNIQEQFNSVLPYLELIV